MISKDKYELGLNMYKNEDISIGEISKRLKISRSRFSTYLKENNVEVCRRMNKNNVDSDIFENIDTSEKAYWLGFMYADGYIISNSNTIGLGLSEKDLHHLEKFKIFLNYKGKIRYRDKYKSVSIEFRDSKMWNDLYKNGCIPKKSLILEFPNEDILEEKFYKDFIRGYFDGDGSICNTEKTKMVSLIGTFNFLEKICEISNISKDRIYKLDKNSKQFRIVLSSNNDIFNFVKFLYKDAKIFMDRKYKKYNDIIINA